MHSRLTLSKIRFEFANVLKFSNFEGHHYKDFAVFWSQLKKLQ